MNSLNLARVIFDPSLYLVLDPSVAQHGKSVELILSEAISGGVTVVQVREKNCSNEEFLGLAWKVSEVLKNFEIPLIVNDRVDVARLIQAQGVHIGQNDLHWSEARRLLGPQAIIGVSVENLEQASAMASADVDYLGVSSVFPTATKKDVTETWGLGGLKTLRAQCTRTLVGIGGIDLFNASSVVDAGADGIAVVSAICNVSSPKVAAQSLLTIIKGAQK